MLPVSSFTVICIVLFGIFYVKRTILVSQKLHAQLIHSILRCPISFFDTTPTGRIINRFSQDLEAVDSTLPFSFEMVLFCFSSLLGVVAAITYSLHWFLLVVIPLGILYYFILVKTFFSFIEVRISELKTKHIKKSFYWKRQNKETYNDHTNSIRTHKPFDQFRLIKSSFGNVLYNSKL